MKRRCIGLGLLLLCLGDGGGVARAAQAEGAAQAFAAATRHYQRREYVRAIAEFERAYKIRPHYRVQCSIARCYENLDRVVEAAEHYRRCLREGAARSPIAARIQASLEAMAARISWVDLVGSERATVFVDGVAAGLTPRRLPLDPGRHAIEVRREGWRTARSVVDVLGGESRTLELRLARLEAQQREPRVTLAVPAPAPEPAPAAPPPSRRRVHQAWFWTTASLSVALAGAAIGLGLQAMSRRTDYEANPTKGGLDAFLQSRLLANLFWGLAGAAAVSGTVLVFFTDFGGARGREVAAGVGLGGRF